jgi:hypothetical protein
MSRQAPNRPAGSAPVQAPLPALALSHRDRALLRAAAAGRCELVCGCRPALLIDGRWCCDQGAAHQLAAAGLLAPSRSAPVGTRVPAELTEAGRAVLAEGWPEDGFFDSGGAS